MFTYHVLNQGKY